MLDSSYQGVKTFFVLAYDNNQVSVHSFKKYFLPRVRIEKYNIEIDGRNFYDQPINHSIKQYDLVKKVITGQREDYTTDCLLGFAYFEKKLQINCSWFKQTKSFRCWFKSNLTNYFYWKSKINSSKYKSNNLLHSQTIKRNNITIF